MSPNYAMNMILADMMDCHCGQTRELPKHHTHVRGKVLIKKNEKKEKQNITDKSWIQNDFIKFQWPWIL